MLSIENPNADNGSFSVNLIKVKEIFGSVTNLKIFSEIMRKCFKDWTLSE